MMARVAVVLLYRDGVRLTDNVPLRGQNLSESIPVVCVKNAVFQVF